jgi:glycosyltransferase involved in cell wall biosynthesis
VTPSESFAEAITEMKTESNAEQRDYRGLLLSVVVPLYNERRVLATLHERLARVLESLPLRHEIILVDDGSRDGSGQWITDLAARVANVRAVRLSRNFGKEAALTAGIDHSGGDLVVVIDADLQDPPELIPDMLAAWAQGAEVVTMKRRSRAGETGAKKLSAHLFYRLLNRISDVEIPEDTGDFRLMSRKAVDALAQLRERNRYMKGLFAWVGMPSVAIEYDREPRAAGSSQWNFLSLLRLAFEGVTSFSIVPLRLVTGAGVLTALGGMLFGLWIIAKTLVLGEVVHGYPSLVAIMTFLGGVQLISIGLLGEYVGKTYFEAKQRPIYLVRDVVQKAQGAGAMRVQSSERQRDAA